MMKNLIVFLVLIFLIINSCANSSKKKFIIGVSQCSEGLWHDAVNKEIKREASLKGIDVKIKSVNYDSDKQIQDIEEFIRLKVDLIIVSPNESAKLTPVISEAFQMGIPILIIENEITNDNYTAYVGADNYRLAYQIGTYIHNKINKGNIVIIRGLSGSAVDKYRYEGFMEAIRNYPDLKVIAESHCGFQRGVARTSMTLIIKEFGAENIDAVFAMNDPMAAGVNDACDINSVIKRPLIIGIDALPGVNGGMDYVNNNLIDASFINPIDGTTIMDVAYKILNNIPYKRLNFLNTAYVDKSNLHIIKLQTDLIEAQQDKLDTLTNQLNFRLMQFAKQKIVVFVLLGLIILSIVLMIKLYLTIRSENQLNNQLNNQNDDIKEQVGALRSQKEQLISLSQQLDAATQAKLIFFTDISHEFKTPLTLIMGPVQELIKSENLSKEDKESLYLIQRNSNKLMELLNEVLDFHKYESGKMEINYSVGKLDEFFRNINQLFRKFILQKQVHFTFETDSSDLTMAFDKEKMEKIYFNLLSNAFKFVLPNGEIKVIITQSNIKNKLYARLSVYNSDSYIPEDKIKKIFNRFYHIDNRHENSGIGLALTLSLVKLHGGEIQVESDKNFGTTFIVTIPMNKTVPVNNPSFTDIKELKYTQEQIDYIPVTDDTDNILDENFNSEKPKVLIIEDNGDMRKYIKTILKKDYNIIQAADGDEGINKAYKYIPDIIVSDIMMPGKDGYELCKMVRSNISTKDIPVILLTACVSNKHKVKGYESDADAYLVKPFSADVLKTRISKLIERRKNIIKTVNDSFFVNNIDMKKLADSQMDLIKKIIRYAEFHITEQINIDDLASYIGMSKSKLYRKLKDITQYSPIDIINLMKLKKGLNLILSEQITIAEAAYKSGFSSPCYFTKTFIKYYNESPREYLKRYSAAN